MKQPTPQELTHRLTFAAFTTDAIALGLLENFAEVPDSRTRRQIIRSSRVLREIACLYKQLAQGIERNSPKATRHA